MAQVARSTSRVQKYFIPENLALKIAVAFEIPTTQKSLQTSCSRVNLLTMFMQVWLGLYSPKG